MPDPILRTIDRSNQRGGRPLSVVDLIEAGTLSRLQCAWLLERILGGSSFLVGASPGGAGKTTIMGALLAMAPPPPAVHITNPGTRWQQASPGECVVCYEVSRGAGYDGYLYGSDVKQLCALGCAGCRIVANLHADTLEEARQQVVNECGATESEFQAFGLFIPIRVRTGRYATSRAVDRILYVDNGAWKELAGAPCSTPRLDQIAAGLGELQQSATSNIAAVRRLWLARMCG